MAKRKETKKHDFPLMILLYLKKGVEFLSSSVVRTIELSLPRPGFDLVGQINKYREVIFLKKIGKGIVREFGIYVYTLYLKWTTNKDLLYSTVQSAQCYVAAWMGAGLGEE